MCLDFPSLEKTIGFTNVLGTGFSRLRGYGWVRAFELGPESVPALVPRSLRSGDPTSPSGKKIGDHRPP